MKRLITLILFLLTSITAVEAQLVFNPTRWDFGRIEEANGIVEHTFRGIYQGERPMVILDAVASCGCTTADFSRKPLRPGDAVEIVVRFDPTNRPGTFEKDVTIYSTERRKVATLTVCGAVTPRTQSVEERYPVAVGEALRLGELTCAFGYLPVGQRKQMSIRYINTGSRPLQLALRTTASSGLLEVLAPQQIAPAEEGELNFAYENPAAAPRYGTVSDAVEIWIDGVRQSAKVLMHGIGIDNPQSTPAELAPRIEIKQNFVKFGAVKRRGAMQRATFEVHNAGHSPLVIRAVEGAEHFTVALAPGTTLAPDERLTVEVLLNPRQQEWGFVADAVALITNAPDRPMLRVRLTATIEE